MKTASQWLEDDNTYTTCVMAILLDKYSMDFVEWDPVTVEMQLKDDFKVVPDSQLMDKIGAGSSLLTSNLFFKSLEAFNAICNVLNLGITTSETFLPADLDDIHWGLLEARLLLGDVYTEESFSHDIANYCGQLLESRGIYEPPQILQFSEYPEDVVRNLSDIVAGSEEGFDLPFYNAHLESMEEERTSMTALANSKLDELVDQLSQLPIEDRNDAWFNSIANQTSSA